MPKTAAKKTAVKATKPAAKAAAPRRSSGRVPNLDQPLDLSGFNIGPESIQMETPDFKSDDWNGEVLRLTCSGVSATVAGLTWSRAGSAELLAESDPAKRRLDRTLSVVLVLIVAAVMVYFSG